MYNSSTVQTDANKSVENQITQTTVSFPSTDGFPLTGTLFTGSAPKKSSDAPLILISSAASTSRDIYRKFARALVASGGQAVMTYDYRGLPGSPKPGNWRERIYMGDWGVKDMPAAAERLQQEYPKHPLVGIGHSFGGLAIGLCGEAHRYERYCTVASSLGHWRHTESPWQVFFMLNFFGLPISVLFGTSPRWLGFGVPTPASVVWDCTRWCNNPNFFFEDKQLQAAERMASVEIPILGLGFSDDPWSGPTAMGKFFQHMTNADITARWLTPDDAGGKPIKHLGFFRSHFEETLWPNAIDWLLGSSTGQRNVAANSFDA